MYILEGISTLADLEKLFTLPYEIEWLKYQFEEEVKEILAQALFTI
jgi:hypothetical protein